MHAPLLSFLTAFEHALVAAEPKPEGDGSWVFERSVNYGQGLARMSISVRQPGAATARGHAALQGYRLGDGTLCLKASLHWTGTDQTRTRSIYSKPDIDWNLEAQRTAADWLQGPKSAETGQNTKG